MPKRIKKLPVSENVLRQAQGALIFLLSQNLELLKPGNWRDSEWAMTTSAWQIAEKELEAILRPKKKPTAEV